MSNTVERGPNYDWKHEAKHYKDEADSLRTLLRNVENSNDRYFSTIYLLMQLLKKIECECAGEGVDTCYRCEALHLIKDRANG